MCSEVVVKSCDVFLKYCTFIQAFLFCSQWTWLLMSQPLPCVVNALALLDLFISRIFSLSDPSAFAQRARVMRSLNNFCPLRRSTQGLVWTSCPIQCCFIHVVSSKFMDKSSKPSITWRTCINLTAHLSIIFFLNTCKAMPTQCISAEAASPWSSKHCR